MKQVRPDRNREFDSALLKILNEAKFRVVGVVIDKLALRQRHGDAAAHPYHLALVFYYNVIADF